MGHFAKLNEDKIVTEIIVVGNGAMRELDFPDSEPLGIEFIHNVLQLEGNWVQTSYNANFRKNYASPGMVYDEERDAFYTPLPPEAELEFNEETCRWILPDGSELP